MAAARALGHNQGELIRYMNSGDATKETEKSARAAGDGKGGPLGPPNGSDERKGL
jgi:hypothetical protein